MLTFNQKNMNEVILDTETTGLSVREDHRIIEIACIETENLIPTKKIFYNLLIQKERYLKMLLKFTDILMQN